MPYQYPITNDPDDSRSMRSNEFEECVDKCYVLHTPGYYAYYFPPLKDAGFHYQVKVEDFPPALRGIAVDIQKTPEPNWQEGED